MRAYGNLMNRVEEGIAPKKPEVGMGGTVLMFSDRRAVTIIEVSPNGKTIRFQDDKAIRTDNNGMCDSQQYRYEPDPKGMIETATIRKNGTFVIEGESMRKGTIVRVGERDHYHDYSF